MSKLKQKIQKKSKNSQQDSTKLKKPLESSLKESSQLNLMTSKKTELPTAPILESNSDQTDATGNFKKIIDESKQKIFESEQKKKDPRGRKPLPRDSNGNIIRDHSPQVSQNLETTTTQKNSIDMSQLLVEPLIILSNIPARKNSIPELALNQDEALALAQSIDKVFNAYIPDVEKMSPKAAALLTLGLTVSTLTLSKMSIYSSVMSERQKHTSETPRPVPDGLDEVENPEKIEGKNYFARRDPFATT